MNFIHKCMSRFGSFKFEEKIQQRFSNLSSLDMKFLLDFQVINFFLKFYGKLDQTHWLQLLSLKIIVKESIGMHRLWNRNTLIAVLLLARNFLTLLNFFEFKVFEHKNITAVSFVIECEAFFKLLAFFFYIEKFRLLKKIVRNADEFFESEPGVEMYYRKLMRTLMIAMVGNYVIIIAAVSFIPLILGGDYFPTFPVQLPFTR